MKLFKYYFFKILIVTIVMWLSSSVVMYFLEKDDITSNIKTIGDALWWSIITLTTIAYGDKVPVTIAGKIFAVLVIVFGIGTVSILVGKISTFFIHEDHKKEEKLIEDIHEDIESLEDNIENLEHKIDYLIEQHNEKEDK